MGQIVVETRDLKRFFKTGIETVRALDGINLKIAKGDFVVFSGPSGSGKSTLLNVIGMLDRPTSGEVFLNGRPTHSMTRHEQAEKRKQSIGFVFQAYNLIPVLTVRENVEYVMQLLKWDAKKRRDRALEVLGEVGLGGMSDRRPTELSGGQQQRVAVARAIASRPELVLADEPTANLDSATGNDLLDLMSDLNQRYAITFLFSSHDGKVVRRARRLIQLRDGMIEGDEER